MFYSLILYGIAWENMGVNGNFPSNQRLYTQIQENRHPFKGSVQAPLRTLKLWWFCFILGSLITIRNEGKTSQFTCVLQQMKKYIDKQRNDRLSCFYEYYRPIFSISSPTTTDWALSLFFFKNTLNASTFFRHST